jgi:hypothetical protein
MPHRTELSARQLERRRPSDCRTHRTGRTAARDPNQMARAADHHPTRTIRPAGRQRDADPVERGCRAGSAPSLAEAVERLPDPASGYSQLGARVGATLAGHGKDPIETRGPVCEIRLWSHQAAPRCSCG